jgi:hypothetical protein
MARGSLNAFVLHAETRVPSRAFHSMIARTQYRFEKARKRFKSPFQKPSGN